MSYPWTVILTVLAHSSGFGWDEIASMVVGGLAFFLFVQGLTWLMAQIRRLRGR